MATNTSRISRILLPSILVAAFNLSLPLQALEQESSDTNKTTIAIPKDLPAVPTHDIDNEITNARLRAATGAKSQWSFSSSFDYLGASLKNPFGNERPKVYEAPNAANPILLSGNLGVKYRVTAHDHLLMGFGIMHVPEYVVNKKTGKIQPEQNTVSSPHLDYVKLFRAADIQNVVILTASQYTAQEDLDLNLVANAFLSHTMMTNIANSKVGIGMYSYISQDYFSSVPVGQESRTMFLMFGFNPLLEYSFSDKISIRTSTGWLNWMVMNSDKEKAKLANQTQTLGVGIAIKRDFYLYPNVQWKWTSMNADNTTVGLSANINL